MISSSIHGWTTLTGKFSRTGAVCLRAEGVNYQLKPNGLDRSQQIT